MTTRHELRGLKDLLVSALRGGATTVEEMHASIARYPFAILESVPTTRLPARAAHALHDGISGLVYAGVRGFARLAGGAAELALLPLEESSSAAEAPAPAAWEHAIGALNGFVGDRLERERSPLRLRMEFRHAGRSLALEPEALRRAYPEAGRRLAVFVHGLAGNERTWRFFSRATYGNDDTSYGSQLARDLGYAPLYLRYNTGLHVSENGALLAERLRELAAAWPGGVEELVLVGHSMGGLVLRSACHQGRERADAWVDAVRHVFCLGTPHLGAPLEKLGNVAGWALGALDVTRPIGKIVNGRSAGIKDLRFGYLVEDDWRGKDLDALLENDRHDIPFLDTATHYFVAATLTRSPSHPVGYVIGDTLVRFPSASGGGAAAHARRIPFQDEHGHHVGRLGHMRLLNHPAVYVQIRAWLEAARAAKPPEPATPPALPAAAPRG
jgi:pimeloyl-ACP methyl ester carboxylesterase